LVARRPELARSIASNRRYFIGEARENHFLRIAEVGTYFRRFDHRVRHRDYQIGGRTDFSCDWHARAAAHGRFTVA
jgi:hypothetical protein